MASIELGQQERAVLDAIEANPFAGQLLLLRRRARFIECHPARYSGFHRRETRIGFSGMSNGRGAA